jgi:hypothetical protein
LLYLALRTLELRTMNRCSVTRHCCLTGVAADGEVMERAQAFACAHVRRAVLYDSPQLNAIR